MKLLYYILLYLLYYIILYYIILYYIILYYIILYYKTQEIIYFYVFSTVQSNIIIHITQKTRLF